MNVLRDWRTFPKPSPDSGAVLSVGNFDGVHLGHARMLAAARDEARRRNLPFFIMTFEPHPSVILRPPAASNGAAPRLPLLTPDQKNELLAGFDPDTLLIIDTTREFLAMPPEHFLHDVVRSALGATVMVEGPTFTFGRGAKGNVDMLARRGPEFGIQLVTVPTREVVLTDLSLVNVSSSLTRWLLQHGRVADAARCLGRPYALRGTVVEGQKRGRSIGFPTANLDAPQLLPGPGIYAGHAALSDGRRPRAAISVGDNPTFRGQTTTVEAFLLDFSGNLYGQTLELHFDRWLRDMIPFSGAEPLIRQIQRDVEAVRTLGPDDEAQGLAPSHGSPPLTKGLS